MRALGNLRAARAIPGTIESFRRQAGCALLLALLLACASEAARAEGPMSGRSAAAVPAAQDPAIAEAELAVRMRDFDRAIAIWTEAAKRGHPEAAYRLGVAYRSGLGVEKRIDRAVEWFGAAAGRGHADAQFALGTLFLNGTGVEQNRDEAIRLFGLAARAGHRKAKSQLERLERTGAAAFSTAGARINVNRSDPREALAQAIRMGNAGAAREALARGAPIDGAPGDVQHWRPLILSIHRRQPELVRLLLEQGADPNITSRAGEPALVLSIRTGNKAVVRRLLEAGASPESRAVGGYTALMEAARLGHAAIARDLLRAGADATIELEDGTSAAAVARRFGSASMASELASRGASTAVRTESAGRLTVLERHTRETPGAEGTLPPVIEAARRGDVALLREMIDRKVDLGVSDAEGGNALTRASAAGRAEAVSVLLAAGLVPDSRGRGGVTPLMEAMGSDSPGTEDVVAVLLEAAADPHARDDSGAAVIEYAVRGGTKRKLQLLRDAGGSWTPTVLRVALGDAAAAGRLEVVDALLFIAGDQDIASTAVCRAAEHGHREILKRFVSKRGTLEADCGAGRTPLTVAAHHGDADLVGWLIEVGADPNGGSEGSDTALVEASGRGHREVVALLLKRGADVNRRGARRMTALMAAASHGDAELVEVLLKAGANPRMRSDTRQTALDLARQSGSTETAASIEGFSSGWRGWLGAKSN